MSGTEALAAQSSVQVPDPAPVTTTRNFLPRRSQWETRAIRMRGEAAPPPPTPAPPPPPPRRGGGGGGGGGGMRRPGSIHPDFVSSREGISLASSPGSPAQQG